MTERRVIFLVKSESTQFCKQNQASVRLNVQACTRGLLIGQQESGVRRDPGTSHISGIAVGDQPPYLCNNTHALEIPCNRHSGNRKPRELQHS